MFLITQATQLAENVKQLVIEAPLIAKAWKPGQFAIVRPHEYAERIPLTIAATDFEQGTITFIIQAVGKTTALLVALESGDAILDVVGPLGKPSEIEKFGHVVVIGGGVGTAIAFPTAVAMQQAGNKVTCIIGFRNKKLVLLEDQLRESVDQLFVMTDDGTYGEKGFVTNKLQTLIDQGQVDHVLAIGPIPMMAAVAEVTRPQKIHTIVSLNPIMVDGTGMCGGCRVYVDGKTQFACVDGPEFDAHLVDFKILAQRNTMYHKHETKELENFKTNPEESLKHLPHRCKLEQQIEIKQKNA